MKPRGPDGTLQARIFRLLRSVGSLDAELISQHVGTTRGSCATACRRLEKRGKIQAMRMRRKWVMYRALPGKREPEDMRGRPAACRNGGYANVLAMMRAKCGAHWRPRPRGIALEEAWPRR